MSFGFPILKSKQFVVSCKRCRRDVPAGVRELVASRVRASVLGNTGEEKRVATGALAVGAFILFNSLLAGIAVFVGGFAFGQ